MPDETKDPRDLQITVEIKGDARNFDNFDALDKWLAAEWKSFEAYGKPAGGRLYGAAISRWQAAEGECASLRNRKIPAQPLLDKLVPNIKALFTVIPTTDSPEGVFLSKLARGDVAKAAGAASVLFGSTIPSLDNPHTFAGAVLATSFGQPNKRTEESIIASVNIVRSEFRQWFEETARTLIATLVRQGDDSQKATEKCCEALNKEITTGHDQLANFDTASKESLEKYRSEIEALIKTYDDKLALQAPANYWISKAKHHRFQAWLWGIAFVVAMGFAIWGMIELAKWLMVPSAADATSSQPSQTLFTAPLANIAAFGVITTMIVWVLRLLARNMVSNQHLITDAKERHTMIVTYLALQRSEKPVAPEQLELILKPIFRPAADGIVKEDAGPGHWLELLFRGKGS